MEDEASWSYWLPTEFLNIDGGLTGFTSMVKFEKGDRTVALMWLGRAL